MGKMRVLKMGIIQLQLAMFFAGIAHATGSSELVLKKTETVEKIIHHSVSELNQFSGFTLPFHAEVFTYGWGNPNQIWTECKLKVSVEALEPITIGFEGNSTRRLLPEDGPMLVTEQWVRYSNQMQKHPLRDEKFMDQSLADLIQGSLCEATTKEYAVEKGVYKVIKETEFARTFIQRVKEKTFVKNENEQKIGTFLSQAAPVRNIIYDQYKNVEPFFNDAALKEKMELLSKSLGKTEFPKIKIVLQDNRSGAEESNLLNLDMRVDLEHRGAPVIVLNVVLDYDPNTDLDPDSNGTMGAPYLFTTSQIKDQIDVWTAEALNKKN